MIDNFPLLLFSGQQDVATAEPTERQYLVPAFGYVNEQTTKDYLLPSFGYLRGD